MKKICIVGDSHTQKMGYVTAKIFQSKSKFHEFKEIQNIIFSHENHIKKSTYIDNGIEVEVEDNHYVNLHQNLYEVVDSDISVSLYSFPGYSAYSFNYNDNKHFEEWNKPGNIIMPCLGYIDIKNHFPIHDNADETAKKYVEKTIQKFNKAEVVFLEPFPQFVAYLTMRWVTPKADAYFDFEERHHQHILFMEALKKYSKIYGLREPISIAKILGFDWMEPFTQSKKIPMIYNDHALPEYYEKIVRELMKYE
jgi:hypothetical protein